MHFIEYYILNKLKYSFYMDIYINKWYVLYISKAVASTLKVVSPGSRCGCSRKWVWPCKEVGVVEERR